MANRQTSSSSARRSPVRKAGAPPKVAKIRARRKKALPKPLVSTPGAKEVRDRISDYVNAVVAGRNFNITSRGKTVAILAPPHSLPKGQRIMETVSTTDIKSGKRRMSLVAVHGPYSIERGGEQVAVLYSPTSSLPQVLERFVSEMDDLKLLDEGKARRVQLRQRADEAIRARVHLLRSAGDSAMADKIEAAHSELDREI
jgi:antitoxin (DNA-binding transcriptional repressor) of toxin-antitoxin stability system